MLLDAIAGLRFVLKLVSFHAVCQKQKTPETAEVHCPHYAAKLVRWATRIGPNPRPNRIHLEFDKAVAGYCVITDDGIYGQLLVTQCGCTLHTHPHSIMEDPWCLLFSPQMMTLEAVPG